jgi:hypothetical protein
MDTKQAFGTKMPLHINFFLTPYFLQSTVVDESGLEGVLTVAIPAVTCRTCGGKSTRTEQHLDLEVNLVVCILARNATHIRFYREAERGGGGLLLVMLQGRVSSQLRYNTHAVAEHSRYTEKASHI